jgi:Short C-terminal domain
MQLLTPHADQAVQNLAQRYGVSANAVETLLAAVVAGGGTMAQFYHSELGGGGQWMQGGMTMVGDMFNSGLQSRVAGLCSELSALMNSGPVYAQVPRQGDGFVSQNNSWWPAELGYPSSSGGQNQSRYAYFPQARRLATETFGQLAVYDTLDHQIGGVQQQQGGGSGSFSFSSQFGTFTVDSLPRVQLSGGGFEPAPAPAPQPVFQAPQPPPVAYNPAPNFSATPQPAGDILSAIERLGQLYQQGVLSDDEFRQKKADLLSRL